MLKARRAKRCLRCHIWPGGEVIQKLPPHRFPPTDLVARIPRGNLPTCFFLSSLTHKQQMPHAKPKIAGVTLFDFILLFLFLSFPFLHPTNWEAAKFITAPCHSICIFLCSSVSPQSVGECVCVRACACILLCAVSLQLRYRVLQRLICGPLCLSRQWQRFININ